MKAHVLNSEGKRVKEIELPKCFSQKIREDIVALAVEIKKKKQPYAPNFLAGEKASASGKIRHMRHKWKTAYGYGISRVPRKIFWRRGDRFYWVGATIASAVKGRRAHPPKILSMLKIKKMNKKQKKLALTSAISATASKKAVENRYESLKKQKGALDKIDFPIIFDNNITKLKTKEFFIALEKILGKDIYKIAIQKKTVRAGKGKLRGRKYKKNAGLLFVVGKNEKIRKKGIDVKTSEKLGVADLTMPLGRLTAYSEQAIVDLKNKFENQKVK